MKNSLFGIFLISLFLFSCNSQPADKASSGEKKEDTTKEIAKEAPKRIYKITPMNPRSPEFPDARITSMAYKNGTFDFGVEGDNYKLGEQTSDAPAKMCANSAKGQHIHLIVDNEPYAAKYTSNFDYDIEDGEHHLLAFLSRSYHESIKSPGAALVQKIEVKDKSITSTTDIDDPMIFYSRPKGTYVGKDTEKVMLDFYVANAQLGPNYRLKANINDHEQFFVQWQPYIIEGLPMGENTITLTLTDANGKKIDSPLNPVTRKFTLKADPMPAK